MTELEDPTPRQETPQRTDKDHSQPFTTEPKTRRHLYGLTAMRRRAALLMEKLFQNDFVLEAPYAAVQDFVVQKVEFISPQERTLTEYIGRPTTILDCDKLPETRLTILYEKTHTPVFKKYSSTKRLCEKTGLCQKLGYMKLVYRGEHEVPFLVFNHKEVPLPYHLKQQPLLDSEKSETLTPESEASKDDLCVAPIEAKTGSREAYGEALERDRRERRVSKQHAQICSNLESESIPQQPQSPAAWLTTTQKAILEERDRKRLEILNRDLLRHLERSAKKQP